MSKTRAWFNCFFAALTALGYIWLGPVVFLILLALNGVASLSLAYGKGSDDAD